jgi:hypothetical protein
MALPDVPVTVVDGGLGQLPTSTSRQAVKIGICSGGVVGTLYGVSTIGAMTAALGQGALVEAGAVSLAVAGGPLYLMPINPSSNGSASAVVHTGSGAATMTVSVAPAQTVVFQCIVAGALGTAQFQVTVGSGTPFNVTSASSWSSAGYLIPGTLTTWVFTAGSYIAGGTPDIYTQTSISTTVVHTQGAGPAVPVATSSPLDAYNAVITIKTAGAPGTGAFTYSLDGGNTVSQTIAIPGSGLYAIPSTGVFLTFSGAAVVGDLYTFTTTSAGYSNTDVTNAFTTLLGLSQAWGFGHLVGAASSSANAASSASTVDTQMQTAFNLFRFARFFTECPTSETDSTVIAAFASFASTQGRVAVCAGDFGCVSPITGRILRRNCAWIITARLAATNPGQDGSDVGLGPLPTVSSLYRDDGALGGTFDAARFCSLRTIIGKQGYFITNVRTMATAGSDFTYMSNCRVMDAVCTIARAALLNYLNHGVRVSTSTGFIDERDAQRIEKSVNAQLKAGVIDTGDATAASIQLSRTQNIISTNAEPVTCSCIPLGYFRSIPLTVGFTNPALAA